MTHQAANAVRREPSAESREPATPAVILRDVHRDYPLAGEAVHGGEERGRCLGHEAPSPMQVKYAARPLSRARRDEGGSTGGSDPRTSTTRV